MSGLEVGVWVGGGLKQKKKKRERKVMGTDYSVVIEWGRRVKGGRGGCREDKW